MKIIRSPDELRQALSHYRSDQIALVPTMGCLHEGHLSLIRQAKRLADVVVVSIYVNPLQFGANEDLDKYPKPFENDVKLCEQEGVDFIFNPATLYPESGIQVGLHVNDLSKQLCGGSRIGHFDGVVTVVNILFNIVRPQIAVFGEKDFQQLSIIRRMVADLHMSVDIIGSETVRETDGLAKSSRNTYLSADERKRSAEIFQALCLIRDAFARGVAAEAAISQGVEHLASYQIKPEYLGIFSEKTLLPLDDNNSEDPLRIFVAARVGTTRLIDNMPLAKPATKE